MSGDMKSDNVSSGQESRERDKNVSDEFFNLENKKKRFQTVNRLSILFRRFQM